MTQALETDGPSDVAGCFGPCHACGRRHQLGAGRAREYAREVMREFESMRRLDFRASQEEADPRLSFENLFPAGRGNMFGVLECEGRDGQTVVLRAFSSLFEGIRQIEGWVDPILSRAIYVGTILPAQAEIKSLTAKLAQEESGSSKYQALHEQRKQVSQSLWNEMCGEYRFRNFRGEERRLHDAVVPGAAIPGGIGECCAPKLLHHAACHGLRPRGIAEFYWSDSAGEIVTPSERAASDSATDVVHCPAQGRVRGRFYPSCEARCQPLLGFMLCGANS